jgi:hypothetical protein
MALLEGKVTDGDVVHVGVSVDGNDLTVTG